MKCNMCIANEECSGSTSVHGISHHVSNGVRSEHVQGREAHATADARGMLNAAGLRSTKERETVLLHLMRTRGPSSVEDLFDGVGRMVNKVTLYRTLERFADVGLVERVQTNDRARHYEFQHEHHHHITCTRCNLRVQVTIPEHELLRTIDGASDAFHAVTSHTLEFYGVCLGCARAGTPATNNDQRLHPRCSGPKCHRT